MRCLQLVLSRAELVVSLAEIKGYILYLALLPIKLEVR